MAKQAKKTSGGAKPPVPTSAARLREGWVGPDGGRIRLIRPGEAHTADALMRLAGVTLDPYLERAVEDGSVSATLLTGLGHSRNAYYEAALRACARPQLVEGMPSMSLILVAEDRAGDVVGVLAAMPAATMPKEAMDLGHTPEQAVSLCLAVATRGGAQRARPRHPDRGGPPGLDHGQDHLDAKVPERCLLERYQQELDSIRHDFHAEAAKHDGEAADRRERFRYVMWNELFLDMESRGEALVRIRADVTWIFDTSGDLLGMRS
ncbi:hypothetical protein ACFXKW_27180 [Streptomyces sp. NPDC059193]|uniref:hypothetical protein n=1 Tax=Streptomyces sp. NPDC059193 TaxID=3346763 RepID=UPI0036A71771